MANYNLTTQQIKDTYQQLVQVSGSVLVDGTGSATSILVDSASNVPFAGVSGLTEFSSSVATRLDYKLDVTTYLTNSASLSTRLTTDEANISTNTSNISDNSTDIASLTSATSSYVTNSQTSSMSVATASFSDYATTASFALNVTAPTWDTITGKPSGLVSSSAQIATDISGAFTSTSASLAAGVATNKSDIATKLDTSTFTSFSSSASTRLTTNEGDIDTNTSNISTNTSNISTQTARVDSLVSATSSYAVKSADNVFSGTQTFESIAVNGTASIAYLQAITGSAKIIGDAFIILNADSPTERYAGIKVYDSGSTPISTGSFIWDSENNDWFYEYQKDDTDYAVALFGPEFATKGTPSYPGTHKVQKGTGGHHLGDSNITDDGTTVSISTPLTATEITASTAFKGNLSGNATTATSASHAGYADSAGTAGSATTATSASYAITASYAVNAGGGGLVLGDGPDSLKSVLTSTTASSTNTASIAIGDSAKAGGRYQIALGYNAGITGTQDSTISIGVSAQPGDSYGVGIGGNSRGGYQGVGIGYGANGGAYGVAIGPNAQITSGDNAISIGRDSVVSDADGIAIGNASSAGPEQISIGKSNTNTIGYGIAIGYNITNQGGGNVGLGRTIDFANTAYSIGIGEGITLGAGASNGVAIGYQASNNNNGVAIGAVASAQNGYNVAIGNGVSANNDAGIAIGAQTALSSNQSIVIGVEGNIDGSSVGAVGIGQGVNIDTSTQGIAIGQGASVTANKAIAIGSGSLVSTANGINIGNTFKYDGTSQISLLGTSVILAASASQTASLIDNYHPAVASGSAQIKHIVNLNQSAYNFVSSSGNIDENTLYFISDAGADVYPGNLQVDGQIWTPFQSGSVSSATSSVDFNGGNFASLHLTAPTFLANPANLQSGTTYTIVIDSGSLVSGYGSAFKFAGGTAPTLSNGVDVLTMVSNGTVLYATALSDFQ